MNNGLYNAIHNLPLRVLTVNIVCTSQKKEYSLNTDQKLNQEDKVYGIALRSATPGTKAEDGNILATSNVTDSTYLELKIKGNVSHYDKLPLGLVRQIGTVHGFYPTGGIHFDPVNSKLICKTAPVDGQSFELIFFYMDSSCLPPS